MWWRLIMKATLLLTLLPLSLGLLGVDVSSLTEVFSCLNSEGYKYAIVRGYMSTGYVDPNAKANIANAKAAGMQAVDVYMFPCVPCGDAASQATALWDSLGGSFGTVWIDVEVYSWNEDQATNQAFISTLVSTLKGHGAIVGIYTSLYNWSSITGGWTGMASLPLWYAHYDDDASFSDFTGYGGWARPAMKQYDGNLVVCGAGVDLNYYP